MNSIQLVHLLWYWRKEFFYLILFCCRLYSWLELLHFVIVASIYVVVHINIILLRLFVQLPISFPVLFYYSLVSMRVNLGASFVLILSYVSDRRELTLSKHKLENLFFFTCFIYIMMVNSVLPWKIIDVNLTIIMYISGSVNKFYLKQKDFAILAWKGGV